jgi:hypothetical protein
MQKENKLRAPGYWVATLLAAAAFLVPGIANLLHSPHIVRDMTHLGYPVYFPMILGSWKVLGALVIVLPGYPRLKEWAYAGMVFDLTCAALSRSIAGDGFALVLVPLLITGVVLASWALRPPGRMLPAVR